MYAQSKKHQVQIPLTNARARIRDADWLTERMPAAGSQSKGEASLSTVWQFEHAASSAHNRKQARAE